MIWDELTSPEIAALDRNIPVVLLIAATEQHGPHLPLATDRLIGEHFCREVEKRISDEVLFLPSIAVACSEHHMELSGSLSLTHDTFLRQVEETIASAREHGFHRFLLFNSHGGNQGIAQVWVERFGKRHPECQILSLTWWKLALQDLRELNESGFGGVGHAGEFETSLMLLIAPHLVRKDQFEAGNPPESPQWALSLIHI